MTPTQYCPDTDEAWTALLSAPEVSSKAGSCIRGAQFHPEALAPTQLNVARTWGLLFDVDEWGDTEPVDPEEIAALIESRCIIWTTYNHMQPGVDTAGNPTPPMPRYAVFVPLEQALLPHQHRECWERVNERLAEMAAPSQHNLDRLRWVPRLPNEEARATYGHWIFGDESERLDPFEEWPELGELSDDLDFATYRSLGAEDLDDPDRAGWVSDDDAKDKARVYFQNVGPEVQAGGRHHELFKIACKLWWDFWLEYDAVAEILHEVNQRFAQPKPLFEVHREVDEAFARTRGHVRVAQQDQAGNAKPAGSMRRPPATLMPGELKQIAQIEKKSTDHGRREIGEILLRLLPRKDGHVEPIATRDQRDKNTRVAARFLGNKLPDHDSQTLADLFAGALAMSEAQHPGAPTVDQVRGIIESAQTAARDRREQTRKQEEAELGARIERAFGSQGRQHAYTPEELQGFADNAGATLTQWRSRWAVVVGSSHYIFVDGDYKAPVGKDNFENAAFVELSPATDVVLHRTNKQGELLALERKDIIKRYGTICRYAIVDLTAQQSFYDPVHDTFHEAPCPLRKDLVPEFVPVIDAWLKTFPPEVMHWVANFTILDRPLAALYLEGQPKSGKTLFAHGLSRLYTLHSGPTDMSAYFDSFNDDLLRCPLLFADERLPKPLQGPQGFDHFREMVQAQSRSLKRKFLANSTLRGYYRLLLAANNNRMIPKGTGFATTADVAAITERLVYVSLDGAPADFLRGISQHERQAFISEDLFAKHALWLRDQRVLLNNDRFLVSGESSRVTQRIEYEGVKGDVLLFLYTTLTGEGFMPTGDKGLLPLFYDERDKTIHVGVNVNILRRHWEDVLGGIVARQRAPLVSEFSDVVRSLAMPGVASQRVRFLDGKQRRYQVINSKHLVRWAEHNDYDPERVVDALRDWAYKKGTVFKLDDPHAMQLPPEPPPAKLPEPDGDKS